MRAPDVDLDLGNGLGACGTVIPEKECNTTLLLNTKINNKTVKIALQIKII